MKQRPILFNGAMVRAILDDSKTQTRRVVKPQPLLHTTHWDSSASAPSLWMGTGPSEATGGTRQTWGWSRCPFGQVGDQLWVRETFSDVYGNGGDEEERLEHVMYKADGDTDPYVIGGRWTPSIHMPRWASRIQLEITGVRVERLQNISEEDAFAEGVNNKIAAEAVHKAPSRFTLLPATVHGYAHLWDSINGAGAWETNPWVWAIDFKRTPP